MTAPDFLALARGDEEQSNAIIPKQPLEVEFGVGSTMPFSVPYDGPRSGSDTLYEALRPLGEDQGPSVTQLQAMLRTDGQARALYRLISQPIRSALKGFSVVPMEDPENPGKASNGEAPERGQEEADFVMNMLTLPPSGGGMTIPLRRVLSQMLLGIFDGFAPFELVYWQPDKGPLKGKYTLQKIAYRPANTITFLTDEKGDYQGLRQRTFWQGKTIDEKIDAVNTLYFAANEEERQFYGVSYFQTAFYHYDKKVKLYYVAHLAAQRAATGTRVGTPPANASKTNLQEFYRALDAIAATQYIGLPGPDWAVEILHEGGNFDFMTYVNHHNSQMSKSVLAAFFDQSQGSGKGESLITSSRNGIGGSEGMSDSFVAMLRAIMDDIADVINNMLIPKFIDWNFGSGLYPTFQWGAFTDESKTAIRDTFDKLATAGQQSNVTPEFMRSLEQQMSEEMGLDIDYAAVDEREAAQAAQAAAQAALGGVPGQSQPAGQAAAPGATGARPPVAPAAAQTPASPAAAIQSAQLAGGGLQTTKNIGFTADDEDFLMLLASDLLDAAYVG